MSQKRVNKIFIGSNIEDGATDTTLALFGANATVGDVAIYDQDFNAIDISALVAAQDITTLADKVYVAQKTADTVLLSSPIQTKNIVKSYKTNARVTVKQVIELDPGALTPTVGETYTLRILYKHNKEVYGDKVPNVYFYAVKATTTSAADLTNAFVSRVNADTHTRNQVTAALINTDHLTLTGKDEEVNFEAVIVDSSDLVTPNVIYTPLAAGSGASVARDLGHGTSYYIKELEDYHKGYLGLTNRRGYPTDNELGRLNYATATDALYDTITIVHNNVAATVDVAKAYDVNSMVTIIAVQRAGSNKTTLGTEHANFDKLAFAFGL